MERLVFGLGLMRPLLLFCAHCDRFIGSDQHWVCSHCRLANERTRRFSFLNKCERCNRSPKSYACPHCHKINFLDRDQDGSHPARAVGVVPPAPAPEPRKPEPRDEKRRQHEERAEELRHEIAIARLDAELAAARARPEQSKAKSPRDRLLEDFEEHHARLVLVHEIADGQLRANAEKHKNDPTAKKRDDEAVEYWRELRANS